MDDDLILQKLEELKTLILEVDKKVNDVNIKADKSKVYLDKFAEKLLE